MTQNNKTFKKSSAKMLTHTRGGGNFFITYTNLDNGQVRLSDDHRTVNSWTNQDGVIDPFYFILARNLVSDALEITEEGEIVATIDKDIFFDKAASAISLLAMMISFEDFHVKH